MTEFPVPTSGSSPFLIASGSDGALWFTEVSGNKIGRISTGGVFTEFMPPTAGNPGGIAAGSDGALWFTEIGGNNIGRITTAGVVTEFAIPTVASVPHVIVAGPDGALWFAEVGGNKIGRISVGGVVTEFTVPTPGSEPFGIAVGADGALWFTELGADKIGRITTGGAITEFTVPTAGSQPAFIAAGPDGALWFTEASGNKIGRITTTGAITEFTLPAGSQPQGITEGPDGALWFTEVGSNSIGRIVPGGIVSEFSVPTAGASPFGIVTGSDGNIWFAEFAGNKIGETAPPPPLSSPSFDLGWKSAGIGVSAITWLRASDNAVEIQVLNGIATIGLGTISNNPFVAGWTVVGTGDFDGDGKSDLVWRRQSDGLVEIQLLSANNPIGGGTIANNPFDAGWNIVATGDFTGNGKSDLVWQRQSDGLVEVQLMNGNSAVGGGTIANNPFGAGWSIVATGDVNGDGKTDLVWQRQSDGLVEIQLMNGNNAVGGGTIANNPFGAGWSVVAAGDFNGDGKSDLAWQRTSDGLVEIQLLNGNTAVGGGVIANNPFGSDWQVVGAADFNGDDKADLVYRRVSDGLTEVQYLNGNVAIGGGIVAYGAQATVAASSAGASNTDAFALGRGSGQEDVPGAGQAVELDLGTGIAANNVWLDRVDDNGTISTTGDNLRVSILGTSDAATLDGAFTASSGSVLKLADSGLVLDSQLNALVQAMASFDANYAQSHGGAAFDPTSPSNAAITDTTVLAAVNTDWHH